MYAVWQDRCKKGKAVVEIEAESAAYLICRRRGLALCAERYLSGYTGEDKDIPVFGLNAVLQATKYIEQMGKSRWETPKKKGRAIKDEKKREA